MTLKVDVEGAEGLAASLREVGPEATRLQQSIRSRFTDLAGFVSQLPEPHRDEFRRSLTEVRQDAMDPLGLRSTSQRCEHIADEIYDQLEDARRFADGGGGESVFDKAYDFAGDQIDAIGDVIDEAGDKASYGFTLAEGGIVIGAGWLADRKRKAERKLRKAGAGLLRDGAENGRKLVRPAAELVNATFLSVNANCRGKQNIRMAKPGDPMTVMGKLKANEVGIVQTGPKSYVVVVRGMDYSNTGANGVLGTGSTYLTDNSPLSQGAKLAMLDAIPPGSNVKLVGHSQGGMAVMDVAADKEIANKYRLTHVQTVGSPAEHKDAPVNSSTKVLHVDNRYDKVPLVDTDSNRSTGDQYNFAREAGKGGPHGGATYAKEMNSENFVNSPEYRQFKPGDGQYNTNGKLSMSVYEIDVDWKQAPSAVGLPRGLTDPLLIPR